MIFGQKMAIYVFLGTYVIVYMCEYVYFRNIFCLNRIFITNINIIVIVKVLDFASEF